MSDPYFHFIKNSSLRMILCSKLERKIPNVIHWSIKDTLYTPLKSTMGLGIGNLMLGQLREGFKNE